MKISSFILIALLFSGFVSAQEAKQYSFTHYSTSSGLLSNQIYATLQDEEGYIWIGGTNGLQRFDGTRYKSFQHSNSDSLSVPASTVIQLLFDKKKRLWLLFDDGTAGIFSTTKFTFARAAVQFKKPYQNNGEIKRLLKDDNGNIFFLNQGYEIATCNESRNEFSYKYNFFKLLPGWRITDLAQQPGTQKYWIGIQDGGIAIFNKATGQLSYRGNNIEKEPAVDAFEKELFPVQMLFDKKGRLWFFYWKQLFPLIYCFDLKTNTYETFDLMSPLRSYHELFGFMEQRDGTIWTYGLKVFARFLEKEKKFQLVYNGYLDEHSISYEAVKALVEDRENNIWAATTNNGLFRCNPSLEYFTNVTHIDRVRKKKGDGSPMSFIQTKWGTFLMGTWEDGLYQYDSNFNAIPTNIKGIDNKRGPFIWSMCASKDSNTIWMSAQPGFYALDQAKRSVSFYNPPALNYKTVRQIAEDKDGNIWLGMHKHGLYKWNIASAKDRSAAVPQKIAELPEESVNKLVVDNKGLLWIATAGHGAYVIDPRNDKVIMHFAKDAKGAMKLPEDPVSSVLEYSDSLMIITTSARVIVYNRLLNTSYLRPGTNEFSGNISAVERDSKGYIWITTTSGLYRILNGSAVVLSFTKNDGVKNESFIVASSRKLPDGRLLFGSTDQFIVFNPTDININSGAAEIYITDFQVLNNLLPVDSILGLKEVVLGPEENSLVVSFSPFIYSNTFSIDYKLEGIDKNWKRADINNQANYSYLPSGTYTLLFRTINPNGELKVSSLQLIIKITPSFWKTWWFYSLLILIFGGVLFWFDTARMKRKEAVEKMRIDIAANLHQEVNTALSNINILSQMAKLKADTEPKKSKEFIEQIHSKSHKMMNAMDDMLWSISPDNDSMQKTIERMQEYIDALNKEHDEHIEMLVDDSVQSLKLNMQFRHEAFLLFKESITGLADACAGNFKIHLTLQRPHLLYSIQFTHSNCNMRKLNNLLQRQDMVSRLHTIKAKLNVEMHKTNSLFELKVPV